MRMWMINPKYLCRQHLLGEHNEIHKLIGTIKKGRSVTGYLSKGLLELHNIKARHDSLVEEMKKRGYNHLTPVFSVPHPENRPMGKVDLIVSAQDLMARCEHCRERMESDDNLMLGMQLHDALESIMEAQK